MRWHLRWLWLVGGSIFLFGVLPYGLPKLCTVIGFCLTTSVSDGIYIGTGITVLWYTVETHYLRREMTRQSELAAEQNVIAREQAEIAIQPLLIIRVERVKGLSMRGITAEYHALVLRNIGHGAALFAEVQPLTVTVGAAGGDWQITAARLDLVEAGDSEPLDFTATGGTVGKRVDQADVIESLRPGSGRVQREYEVVIRYEDVHKRRFESVMRIAESGAELLRHGGTRR